MEYTLSAWAKINLSLDVTGLREDGYHTLDTVMHTVSLCDRLTLSLEEEPGIRLATDRDYLPVDEKNTAYRAAKLFFEAAGRPHQGLTLRIEKHIPSRAGMGGGSADAAAVLRGLNALFGAPLSGAELEALGARIGADVPFCVRGGSCRCTGVGEVLTPAPALPPCFLVICKPPVGVSTPRAYALLDRLPPARTQATPRVLEALAQGDLRAIGESLGNRFEDALHLIPVRQARKAMLAAGALGARMTGSGSAVYGLFPREDAARRAMASVKHLGETFLCTPLGEIPPENLQLLS